VRTERSEATEIQGFHSAMNEACRVLECLIALPAISLLRKVRGSSAAPTAAPTRD